MKYPDITVQSQYSASPAILSLVESMNKNIDPNADIQLFYDKIANVLTAEGEGLDVWGRIVGIGRFLRADNNVSFGFYGSERQPFDQANFWVYGATNLFRLEDSAYFRLIMLKAASNIASTDLLTINRLLQDLLSVEGKKYVIEVGVMVIRFVFEFNLQAYDRNLLLYSGIIPKPAGVGWEYFEIIPTETFGFLGSGLQPFDQGVFTPNLPFIVSQ